MKYYAVIDTNVIVSALLSKNEDSATVKTIFIYRIFILDSVILVPSNLFSSKKALKSAIVWEDFEPILISGINFSFHILSKDNLRQALIDVNFSNSFLFNPKSS